ncbi:FCD domain-containing protein [Devosia sp. YIM 151766]|uniref:FadR/GntR family transcriptional regulator n=1 Tax=Devosia sp. YIM 151766 TaxID=3017325 RepID=UPI00255CC8B8|nr:FCD domain-containing protein [Devosia sp. YIM 151766]WIY53838.1 FCD domain-containing protein [Devosia sp. YIM 151766]
MDGIDGRRARIALDARNNRPLTPHATILVVWSYHRGDVLKGKFSPAPKAAQRQSDDVVRAILAMLERGELHEGDVLPPERELAQQFDIGRNTLREAIKVLQVYGVVDRSPRLGTVIKSANLDHIMGVAFSSMPLTRETFDDIQEFRQVLESGIASRVAERCGPETIEKLEAINRNMASAGDLREQAAHDYQFHALLIDLGGNAVLSRTYRVLGEPIQRLMELGKNARGTDAAFRQHQALIEALRQRDVEAYGRLLARHLAHGRRYLPEQSRNKD